ncbi:MAG: efflux RND transporter periplasmic adaptor subunit [Planctomycetes bacterium]|nr:efflux RND transporter periplasmic adaptor subunit [Planctomycetota bacterium]
MKKNRKRILLIVVLLPLMVGLGAWWQYGLTDDSANHTPATARVVRSNLSSTVMATGAVKPQVGAEVRVGARMSGKVERLHANIGDVVRKGQVIAELEKTDLEAKVRQREAELRLAEARLSAIKALRPREIDKAAAEVTQWQASVALHQKELARQEKLLEQDFTSRQARDRAREQLAVSQARLAAAGESLGLTQEGYREDLKQARAEVDRATAVLADAKVQLSYATITATINGVIASVSTQEGETVAAGLNAPTFVTIIDLGRLQVDTFVDEVDIGKVEVGQEAMFTVDTFPDREFKGRVSAIYPKAVIQENVVNYDVVVTIAGEYKNLLRPEMTTNVTIFLKTQPDALVIPSGALRRERGRSVVYMQTPDGPKVREVTVGQRTGNRVQILDGLSEGQTVFLEPPASSGQRESNL